LDFATPATHPEACIEIIQNGQGQLRSLGAMKPNLLLFHQELTRVSAEASAARVRIRQARTLREVTRHMDVRVRPEFRCLKHMMTELRRLHRDAEHRAEQILRAQLADISALPDESKRRELAAMYRSSDWRLLQGHFPRLARLAESASRTDSHHHRGPAINFPETGGLHA